MSKKNVLILGGGGFIGANVAKQLLESGNYSLTIVDNFSRGQGRLATIQAQYSKDVLTVVSADLTDYQHYEKLNGYFDFVYVLAALVGVDKVNAVPHEVIRVNSLIVLNCLEWLRHGNAARVVFASTRETYAGTVEAFGVSVPTDEKVPLTIQDVSHPRFSYAVTKMLGESGFIAYGSKCDFESVVIRYHNVYGPEMGFRHVIPHLVERFSSGEEPFKIYGHDQTRAFNYIDDAVRGTIAAVEHGRPGEIYHIGDCDEISIDALTRYVGSLFNYQGPYENAATFPGSVSRRCPDILKAVEELDYKPRVHWQEGIALTVDWYRRFLQSNAELAESFYDQYGIEK